MVQPLPESVVKLRQEVGKLIDEKKLIDELKQNGMIADNEYGNAIIDMINSQPKIGDWISCSEKLPENNIDVFALIESGGFPFIAHFCETSKQWINSWSGNAVVKKWDVVKWMQLPEGFL